MNKRRINTAQAPQNPGRAMRSPWTGRTAAALQSALRLSQEAFAAHLGISPRTVAAWHQKPTVKPQSEMQQLLDTALAQAAPDAQARFADLTTPPTGDRLQLDPHIVAALDWLDAQTGWTPGTARTRVAARAAQLDAQQLHDRSHHRARVSQRDITNALTAYYGPTPLYRATLGSQLLNTSIVTRANWFAIAVPLISSNDRLRAVTASPPTADLVDTAAINRLAETLTLETRLVNAPLYSLASIDIGLQRIEGTVGIASFVEYALTLDLLEAELIDAITAGRTALPLRDRYLPDLPAVLDISSRLCAGGALALTAIARPADPFRGPADYLLLIQERSGHVVNAARRLAVIPKGFHQPVTDIRADAQIGATLRREMEEELFGRADIDSTTGDQRSADPMHPSRLSEPLRWLLADPSRLRMECTGFGLNLVSGNYEFASLIVIHDEDFWPQFGGMVEANWESTSLRRYSTQDPDIIGELLGDVAWSNEALFAMLQGLRRLAELDPARVTLPPLDWEITE
ncbi:transcriptional regulator with XRE-family HTH domain [Actinokineospora baliensis]|uniref:helix-turn-helix domain-containing protein n=1 Tax=Actinokineospora baliensis TaxID=547056 RepID=UPI0027DDF739|nr:transcriptional regulator [Actinokineospora baliensis]MBM7770775.1 transcriptional regulator with XRE-family HTH domain [Actinokineospora baliensis]